MEPRIPIPQIFPSSLKTVAQKPESAVVYHPAGFFHRSHFDFHFCCLPYPNDELPSRRKMGELESPFQPSLHGTICVHTTTDNISAWAQWRLKFFIWWILIYMMISTKHTYICDAWKKFIPRNCWKPIRWFHVSRILPTPPAPSSIHTNAEYKARLEALICSVENVLLIFIAGCQHSHQPEPGAQNDYTTNIRSGKKQYRMNGRQRIRKTARIFEAKPMHSELEIDALAAASISRIKKHQTFRNPTHGAVYSMSIPISNTHINLMRISRTTGMHYMHPEFISMWWVLYQLLTMPSTKNHMYA